MKIYCAHPISGLSGDEVINYYTNIHKVLKDIGYTVFQPMTAKGYFRPEKEFKACNYANGHPTSTNHAIKERDQWMVINSDIVLVDFTGAKEKSIGCVSELAWGDILHKQTIVVMDKNNVHQHAFTLEEADIVFETLDEALDYLKTFYTQEM